MAGEWIRWQKGLYGKREIRGTAKRLGVGIEVACVLWMRFWEWADNETLDGWLDEIDAVAIDGIVGRDGFAEAGEEVGWIEFHSDRRARLPNYERLNGANAKRRLRDAEKMRKWRARPSTQSDM